MEDRPSRGRRGSWRRGGRGGSDSDSCGGEHRGRGRGGHHRSRGRREQQHRGRGRGGGSHAAEFHPRDEGAGAYVEEEDNGANVFSRRKLESNWDRYEESERQEPEDDMPTQRGTDYHVLLESAGDSCTHFRFSEEKDWELDSLTAARMCAELPDLQALAQILQQVPLHQRLSLEAELDLVSTPAELPAVTVPPKQDILKTCTAPSASAKGLNTNAAPGSESQVSSTAAVPPVDDDDEELDQLLSLQKPVASASGTQPAAAETARDEEEPLLEDEGKDVTPTKPAPVRQDMTEEDLEDWLDSMIS